MTHKNRISEMDKVFKRLKNATQQKEEQLKKMTQPQFSALGRMPDSLHQITKSLEIETLIKAGEKALRQIVDTAQKELKKDPWGFSGKVALCSLGIGFILGIRYKSSQKREKK